MGPPNETHWNLQRRHGLDSSAFLLLEGHGLAAGIRQALDPAVHYSDVFDWTVVPVCDLERIHAAVRWHGQSPCIDAG